MISMSYCPVERDTFRHYCGLELAEAKERRQIAAQLTRRDELRCRVRFSAAAHGTGLAHFEVVETDGGLIENGDNFANYRSAWHSANDCADHIAELHGNTVR